MIYKKIFYMLSLTSVLMTQTQLGYVRDIEASFCMDDCGQYYLETEDGEYISNIIGEDGIDLGLYSNRFVSATFDGIHMCIECNANIVTDINYSSDCINPVSCFNDPCATIDCADDYECYQNYCGGCYGDCLSQEEECVDFTNIDFGMCDMFLGYGLTLNGCQGISGCGWDFDGIDYSDFFFSTMEQCEDTCIDDNYPCDYDEIQIDGLELSATGELLPISLCFNSLDVAYLQEMIDNSYESGIDLGCEDWDNYCGSPNPYMDDEDSWFWKIIDGDGNYYFSNANGVVEPLELGIQEWADGRLTSIMCGAYIYCQLSGEIPELYEGQLDEIEQFRFEYNYLSGDIPDSICDLELNDNDYLEFDLTGNLLCPPYPECIENSIGYQNTQDCLQIDIGDINSDNEINVLDVVLLIGFILGEEIPSEIDFLLSDINDDLNLNVLDVVALVAIILQ